MSERLYCGDKTALPPGYTGFATRFHCLRKGVGVGLYTLRNIPRPVWYRLVPWYIWFIAGAVIIGLLIFLIVILVRRNK